MERWLTKEEREAWERLQIAYVEEKVHGSKD